MKFDIVHMTKANKPPTEAFFKRNLTDPIAFAILTEIDEWVKAMVN